MSPQRTLERGYAVVADAKSGEILRDADAATAGSEIRATLARGTLWATVDTPEPP